MTDFPRLIEHAFPLKQASLDSVHEKNVRHGHISTLHIWPARRPLAACRAALIATLLPDPGDPEKRRELCEKIGGEVVKKIERKKMPNGSTVERVKEETEGGILHWGRETENADTLDWFRDEIRKAYGGRAPKVLDPFAGGGAIPLEAMRLGCEATAVDINPVAWFILKCTLEYPQKLAGQTRPLPAFILHNDDFMAEYFKKAKGYTAAQVKAAMKRLHKQLKAKRNAKTHEQDVFEFGGEENELHADLVWHVRAWGQWVLDRARRELAQYYPTYAEFEPIKKDHLSYERQPMKLVPLKDDGTPDIDALNSEFSNDYLADKRNPRWIAKPTVAYLWARTVKCKNCRAIVPLLKTRWLCKKSNKRVLLTMDVVKPGDPQERDPEAPTPDSPEHAIAEYLRQPPDAGPATLRFGVDANVPAKGANNAAKREHDKRIGAGTMSRAGAQCPCCGTFNTMQDIRLEGQAGRLDSIMTAVVVDGVKGKEYRLPTEHELAVATPDEERMQAAFEDVPFGVPDEPTPAGGGSGAGRAFSVQGYGLMKWRDLFTPRQLTALGTFVTATRAARKEMSKGQLSIEWIEAACAGLTVGVDRIADRQSMVCRWDMGYTKLQGTFTRFALPITWDYCEGNPFSETTGNYASNLEWVAKYWEHAMVAGMHAPAPTAKQHSAIHKHDGDLDAIITDPPYYDAIPYSDLMDFFYIWLRRTLQGVSPAVDAVFSKQLAPKWSHEENDGELIDDSSRHGNDAVKSKRVYEDGMARVFSSCCTALKQEGRLVVVFAHKHPDAWETLVSAIIRAGFVVDGSWPIQTEMGNRTRALAGAALASSVWLVCKKRGVTAKPGWDNKVLEDMRAKIAEKLRAFWDAGIRGPDFVWAATGPALEAYSRHPVVKKANAPGEVMGVSEFLIHVRRMVVDYVVGQVLIAPGAVTADAAPASSDAAINTAEQLDGVSAYYLLHRNDFGTDEAPVGACILYATACGLSDAELDKTWDILTRPGSSGSGSSASSTNDEDDTDSEDEDDDISGGGGGSKVKLKTWARRQGRSMGYEAPGGKPVPLIDRVHRLMHLWKAGDVHKVDEYLDEHALRRSELFKRVVQSLIELSENSERATLESISNHIGAKGAVRDDKQQRMQFETE